MGQHNLLHYCRNILFSFSFIFFLSFHIQGNPPISHAYFDCTLFLFSSTLEELFKCIARNAFECVMNASNIYEEYEASPWNCTYLTADITIIAQEQLKKSKCSSDGIYEVANGNLNNGDNKVPNSESSQLEDSDADPNDSPHILYSGMLFLGEFFSRF